MSTEAPAPLPQRGNNESPYRHWLTLTGAVIFVGAVFSFVLLWLMDLFSRGANPYIGILTYLVAPAFLMLGLGLSIIGVVIRRRQIRRAGGVLPGLRFDLEQPADRKKLAVFLGATTGFLLLSAVGSYHTYHFTESVTFCGQACHTVMGPERTSYTNGPHARVTCAECHIGAGAGWYVRSKLSGAYQVYATLANKYPRPIPTPIRNLRPAQETCEQCHWPQKFVGNLDRTYTYYLTDPTNTQFTVRMSMLVGGGDPTHGPVEGIHWHMNVGHKVQYIAAKLDTNGVWVPDESRQKIPYVRSTDQHGAVKEFRVGRFTNDIAGFELRTMDCMDCHNRPAHVFHAPNTAVNLALQLGQIDASIPLVKSNALWILTQTYTNEAQALERIATFLEERYPAEPRIKPAIQAVQTIFKKNFFPEMKVNWKVYPNNIGHMYWPGCFRCHDGLHKTADGRHSVRASDCNACHIILAQGAGQELGTLNAKGIPFAHPGDELDPNPQCHECHSGGM